MKQIVLFVVLILSTALAFGFDAAKEFTTNCATCHTIGGGDKTGPDLAGLSKRHTLEWIHKYVNYPEGMIKGDPEEKGYEKPDPQAVAVYNLYRPQLMAEQALTKDQVAAILKYIDDQKKEPKGKILQVIKKK